MIQVAEPAPRTGGRGGAAGWLPGWRRSPEPAGAGREPRRATPRWPPPSRCCDGVRPGDRPRRGGGDGRALLAAGSSASSRAGGDPRPAGGGCARRPPSTSCPIRWPRARTCAFRLGRWPSALADAEAVPAGDRHRPGAAGRHALGALAEIEAALGHDDAAREHAERGVALAQAQGARRHRHLRARRRWRCLALGRAARGWRAAHGLAAERAEGRTDNDEPGIVRDQPDLIEALAAGRVDEAAERLERLERQAQRPRHSWTEAWSAGWRPAGRDDDVDEWFARAVALHGRRRRSSRPRARTCSHGERLRRARRRSDAREPLRTARRRCSSAPGRDPRGSSALAPSCWPRAGDAAAIAAARRRRAGRGTPSSRRRSSRSRCTPRAG